MKTQFLARIRSRLGKWIFILPAGTLIFTITFFAYFKTAFPEVRCEAAKHLDSPENVADCFNCHLKATPKVAQDWYESKHGLVLVKCFVCHGQPDGKGSIVYAVNPDVNSTCRKCHDYSITNMEKKYGLRLNCTECHPFHQNSIHHKAYAKPISKKTMDQEEVPQPVR